MCVGIRLLFVAFVSVHFCNSLHAQAKVDVFYIPHPSNSSSAKKEMEPVMQATKLGVMPIAVEDVNVYVLLDAINSKLKEKNATGFIFFAEPAQANATWTLSSLNFLQKSKPTFAPYLNGKDLITALSEMTLWDVYQMILRGGYGFQEV